MPTTVTAAVTAAIARTRNCHGLADAQPYHVTVTPAGTDSAYMYVDGRRPMTQEEDHEAATYPHVYAEYERRSDTAAEGFVRELISQIGAEGLMVEGQGPHSTTVEDLLTGHHATVTRD
ncbi:hypothetical protein ACFV0R_25635 [Streptomyces sp. NPDC059578]|uniref:hypothetical protein n=1 Tax=Streptomyces sp. NPDC059578 TaxID=3346874 RepID=UPI0036BCB15F